MLLLLVSHMLLAINHGFLLMISCGGGFRGGRSQYHLRQVCVFLDLFVLNKPEVFLSAFDGDLPVQKSTSAPLISTT